MPLSRAADAARKAKQRRARGLKGAPRRVGCRLGAALPAVSANRLYGRAHLKLGDRPGRPCLLERFEKTELRPQLVEEFRNWLRQPGCSALRDRDRDREQLRFLVAAPTLAHLLVGLLAYFWLRIAAEDRASVARALALAQAPDWSVLHGILASVPRRCRLPGKVAIRRGHGAWPVDQVEGLDTAQREVASLRAWHSLLHGPDTARAMPDLGLQRAARATSTSTLALFLARVPGAGPYLAAKVLYGVDLLGLATCDFLVVGPGAVQAGLRLHSGTRCDAYATSGLWPWTPNAGHMQALLGHLAKVCKLSRPFVQVALCMWKMEGVKPAPRAAPQANITRHTLCRDVVHAALRWGLSRTQEMHRADFVSEAVWFALASGGHPPKHTETVVQRALQNAVSVCFPAGHRVAKTVAGSSGAPRPTGSLGNGDVGRRGTGTANSTPAAGGPSKRQRRR